MKEANAELLPAESPVKEETRAALSLRAPQPAQVPAPLEKVAAPITPAQAKVEAIASLTMKAYERAATLVLTTDEINSLQADFPDDAFKKGAAGKENLIYIEHAFLRDRLNQVIGVLQWSIIPRNRWAEPFTFVKKDTGERVEGSRVYVEAMLIIRGAFAAEAVGSMDYFPKNNSQDYSDAVEGAKTAALRRCCKEIGVGLQAWKKDWCEGWWKRTYGRSDPKNTRSTPMRQAQQAAAKTTPAAVKPTCATKMRREWVVKQIGEAAEQVENYLREISWLMPNETLAQLELRFVPIDSNEFALLQNRAMEFIRGEPAQKPYLPHIEEPPMTSTQKKSAPSQGGNKPAAPAPAGDPPKHDDEWFWDVICPVPHKNQNRAEYMQNPDTIGIMYEAANDDETMARRLFGFLAHFEPKGWQKRDGTQMPPSEDDIKFREALDAFGEWHEKNKD